MRTWLLLIEVRSASHHRLAKLAPSLLPASLSLATRATRHPRAACSMVRMAAVESQSAALERCRTLLDKEHEGHEHEEKRSAFLGRVGLPVMPKPVRPLPSTSTLLFCVVRSSMHRLAPHALWSLRTHVDLLCIGSIPSAAHHPPRRTDGHSHASAAKHCAARRAQRRTRRDD